MADNFFTKLGDRAAGTVKRAAKGDVGALAEGALAVGTLGQSMALSQAADEIGLFKKEKPAKAALERIEKTDEEKGKLRGALEKRGQDIDRIYDPSQVKTSAENTSALGRALVDQTQTVSPEQLGNVERAQVSEGGTRPTVMLDRSRVDTGAGKFDTSAVDTGPVRVDRTGLEQVARTDGYQAGQGAAAQSALLQALQQQAAGQGPSLATGQFQQAQDAALAASLAQQASLRGGFDPAAARQIRQSAADLQAQAARDAAQARIQEQMQAREQLAGVAETMETQNLEAAAQDITERGQDITQRAQDVQLAERDALLEKASKELGVDVEKYRADSESRAAQQEIDMAKTQATLEDSAVREQFQANLERDLKQADIDSSAFELEYSTKADVAVKNMMETNASLRTAYNGDVKALHNDMMYYNDLLKEKRGQENALSAARAQLEMDFIADGLSAENAKIRADNLHRAAMVTWQQSINDMRTGIAKDALGAALDGAAMMAGMPPGIASGVSDAALSGATGGGTPAPPLLSAGNQVGPAAPIMSQQQGLQESWGLESPPAYVGPYRPA